MKIAQLEFELSALQLESQVEQLCRVQEAGQIDLRSEIDELRAKVDAKWRDTYDSLNPWQVAKVARHADRPYTLDYIGALFDDFVELHGDRAYADDPAIVGGFARFDGVPLMLIGHQKGRDTRERTHRNFGMPRPEGYRKAMRLMQMAERFALPLLTFIDTPGAFPGIDAEERGQSAAIGESIYVMSQLAVPTLSIVIGEGGSGGALAIGVADRVHMLQYATYSVISPEGCASILWKDAAKAELAAHALCITAAKLKELQLIDDIVREPTGGAHRDPAKAAEYVGRAIRETLAALGAIEPAQRLREREARLRRAGSYESLA